MWRLGPGSVCTFGIEYKPAQIKRLSQYKRVFVLTDNDPNIVRQAEISPFVEIEYPHKSQGQRTKLATALSSLGAEVIEVLISANDPGDMKQDDANHLMRETIGKRFY